MQLRVARLCIDCEELHVDNSCPRCASERYAFLSYWLPSEERRRWRRPSATREQASDESTASAGLARSVGNWFRGDTAEPPSNPLTRKSDHVLMLNFDAPEKEPEKKAVKSLEPQLSKHDVK